jgi:hypothetical protein
MALAGQGDVRALPARGPRPGTLSRSVSRITVRTYTFPSAPLADLSGGQLTPYCTCRKYVPRIPPYGEEKWTERTAARLDLQMTLRPRGRPRRNKET